MCGLARRFIINIPKEELESIERICFQIEQAHWFYEDFVREENPYLPSHSLKSFTFAFFQACDLLKDYSRDKERAYTEFLEYKTRVPVCGGIILQEPMDRVLLVRGWKPGSSWSFPKGKINKGEPEAQCALREILEETGLDASPFLQPQEYLERTIQEQKIRLYIFVGVQDSTEFQTQTRKEIGDIQWFDLKDLPGYIPSQSNPSQQQQQQGPQVIRDGRPENLFFVPSPSQDPSNYSGKRKLKFHLVTAFMPLLRHWIKKQQKKKRRALVSSSLSAAQGQNYQQPQQAQPSLVYSDTVDSDASPADALPSQSSLQRKSNKISQPQKQQGALPQEEPSPRGTRLKKNGMLAGKKDRKRLLAREAYYKSGSESDSESNRESPFEVSSSTGGVVRTPLTGTRRDRGGKGSGSTESLPLRIEDDKKPQASSHTKERQQELLSKEERQRRAMLRILKGEPPAPLGQPSQTQDEIGSTDKTLSTPVSSTQKKKSGDRVATNVETQSSQIGFVPTGILRRDPHPSKQQEPESVDSRASKKTGRTRSKTDSCGGLENPLLCFKFDVARILAAMDG